MTNITFTKMHGIGNDFIVLLEEDVIGRDMKELSKKLCDRKFGIGADQLLVLCKSGKADFKMLIYNSDGGEIEMCGNGIRCLAKYIWERGMSSKSVLEIETLAGIIRPEKAADLIRVDMGEPILDAKDIPVNLSGRVIDHPIVIEGREFKFTAVSMGNPHAVIFVDDVQNFPLTHYGQIIERHELFPNRVNVEFVEVLSRTEVRMRVWERGSGVTLACGTGASAVGVASSLKGLTEPKVKVILDGGELGIELAKNGHVYLTGPAEEVFEGTIKI